MRKSVIIFIKELSTFVNVSLAAMPKTFVRKVENIRRNRIRFESFQSS